MLSAFLLRRHVYYIKSYIKIDMSLGLFLFEHEIYINT